MPDGFFSLGDIIKNDPGLNNVRRKIDEADVVIDFYKIFPDLEKVCEPKSSDKKTLVLRVVDPAWRSELKFNEKVIIKKINDHFGEERIRYLKFSSK